MMLGLVFFAAKAGVRANHAACESRIDDVVFIVFNCLIQIVYCNQGFVLAAYSARFDWWEPCLTQIIHS